MIKNGLKNALFLLTIFSLVLCFGSNSIAGSNANAKIVLDLDPNTDGIQNSVRGDVDDVITVDVIAQDAVNLSGINFMVSFDQTVLQNTSKSEPITTESFLRSLGGTVFYGVTGDAASGTAGLSGSILGATEANSPEGEGKIGQLTFKILSTDQANLTFTIAEFAVGTVKDDILANATGGVINPPIGIGGQVTGGTGGNVYVVAFSDLSSISPVKETMADGSGNYLLSGLSNGSFYIFSFRDLNGDQAPNYGEFQGVYGAPTPVTFSGSDVTGIDFTLLDSTDEGPEITDTSLNRFNLPAGTGPTAAGGLHASAAANLQEHNATTTTLVVEFPNDSIVNLALQDGTYEYFQPATSVPQGDYTFVAKGANNFWDVKHSELTTDESAIPTAPTLTQPNDSVALQASDATAWPSFTWTGGTEGKAQALIIASDSTLMQEIFFEKFDHRCLYLAKW